MRSESIVFSKPLSNGLLLFATFSPIRCVRIRPETPATSRVDDHMFTSTTRSPRTTPSRHIFPCPHAHVQQIGIEIIIYARTETTIQVKKIGSCRRDLPRSVLALIKIDKDQSGAF